MRHRFNNLWWRACGHRVDRISGRAELPDGTRLALGNAPLVTDKNTGAQSVRWNGAVWPVIDFGDPIRLGHPGENL